MNRQISDVDKSRSQNFLDYRFISTFSIINDFIENYRKKKKGSEELQGTLDSQITVFSVSVLLRSIGWLKQSEIIIVRIFPPKKQTD